MPATRMLGLSAILATALSACGDGDGDAGGGGGATGSSGGSSSSGEATGGQTGTSDATTASEGSTSTSARPSETSGSTSDPGSDASSSGGSDFPVDCHDGGLPVRVEGGGEYATVREGVTATPPGSTVWICPGDYTEDAAIQIVRDLTIVGAGPDLVSIAATDGLDRVFLVRDADVTFEGFSVIGASIGIDVGYEENAPRITTMRNLRVAQSRQIGIFIFEGGGVDLKNATANFENVVVEGVDALDGPAAVAGIALSGIQASFVDCSVRDNITRSGGLEVEDSQVDFEGGEVVRNEALFPNGGGARILTELTARSFTIVDSDWGASAAQENVPNDMDCGSGVSNDVGWLGSPANAVCGTDVEGCCTPQ